MKHVLMALVLAVPGALQAEEHPEPIPNLQTCLNQYVDRYEWWLAVNADTPIEEVQGGLWHAFEARHCGTLGIVRCDRTGDPAPCQRDLAQEALALAQTIRDDLPAPSTLEGDPDAWANALYERTYALAHGTSAGPDCEGASDLIEAWCGAHEASNRLRDAVLAWQVARALGAVDPATELGWAGPPPPVRPRARAQR